MVFDLELGHCNPLMVDEYIPEFLKDAETLKKLEKDFSLEIQ
jgi:hypothetical protein